MIALRQIFSAMTWSPAFKNSSALSKDAFNADCSSLTIYLSMLGYVADLFCLDVIHAAIHNPRVTTTINIVANALMSGETPKRTLEKISIGSVVAPGPETKLAITRSSNDKVNDKSQPETIAGKIIGKVISHNTLSGLAPKSMAASSSDSFTSVNLD